MKRRLSLKPINTTADGLAFTIRARYFANSSMANLTNGGGHFPSTGVLEIYESIYDKESGEELWESKLG